ncbi:MAG: hypothetical protein R3D67_14800 [Hyphomicrobiaceae bacterium]
MGDRVEFSRMLRGPRAPWLRGQRPREIKVWGLVEAPAAGIGHNNGPPLEQPVNDAFVRYRWRKAHAEAWKTPSMSILKFRMARAEAAGVSYEEYVATLLDTGRHLQAGDRPKSD